MLEAIVRQTGCILTRAPQGSRIDALVRAVSDFARSAGMNVAVTPDVLTERAALMGLPPAGMTSANGTCRMIRAADGWIAVNLPRADDRELLPAWIDREAGDDPWREIAGAAALRGADQLVADAQTLGLAAAHVHDTFAPSWTMARMGKARGDRVTRPVVLDMSSLWAGPLCGAILAEAGADVIKIESASRPDGARIGSSEFFARLNGRKRQLMLDLPRELARLRELIATADIVIESARPRVLVNWGVSLPGIFASNPHLTWISVTAYGRADVRANWVGFGDDVAAAAGLVNDRDGAPAFIGDAIADPLAGLGSAASAFACLAAGGGFLVDANLYAAARFVAGDAREIVREAAQ